MPDNTTLYQFLSDTAAKFPDKVSFLKRDGNGKFQGKSFSSLKKSVDELCAGIHAEGIRPSDKIAFFCDSSPNWFFTDLAIIASGCVSVPRGTDVTDEDIEYIINHAECRTAVVQNEKTKARLVSLKSKIPNLKKIYILEQDAFHLYSGNDSVQSLLEKGRKFLETNQEEVFRRIESVNPEELAALIYTSGTTGAPKGVMLNQRGWITAIQSTIRCVGITSEDRALSLLPPWHAFERAVEYAVIFLGGEFLVTDIKTLKEDLRDFKPTFFPSVPRIWESLYNGIKAKVGIESEAKQKIFAAALYAGKFWAEKKAVLLGYNFSMLKPGIVSIFFSRSAALVSLILASPGKLFSILVFKKIHQAFGGNLKISISAGSALPGAVDEFLSAIGLTVLEGYGMTETSAVISVRKKESPAPSTLGVPLEGYEVCLKDEKENKIPYEAGKKGTLWVKSRQILMGYYKRPDLNSTVFDQEGFFNTGDLISFTWKGELVFAGRSKDTLVLTGGENVEPVPVEDRLLNSDFIDQIMVVGNDRKSLGAVIVPNFDKVKSAVPLAPADYSLWNSNPKIRELFKKEITRLITRDSGFKTFEVIPGNCFCISPRQFDLDREMTRTLKMKRNIISESFASEIENMYR